MTTYFTITDSMTDPGAPGTSELWKAWWKNPLAIAEASTGAPVVVAGWHPYDMVNVGDGADGVFYDFAVHGSQATITTPDFADGYEYMIVLAGLGNSGTGNLVVSLYKETDAAYQTAATTTATASGDTYGEIEVHTPRLAKTGHFVSYRLALANSIEAATAGTWDITVQKILRARLAWSSGNIDAGTAALYRRGFQQ